MQLNGSVSFHSGRGILIMSVCQPADVSMEPHSNYPARLRGQFTVCIPHTCKLKWLSITLLCPFWKSPVAYYKRGHFGFRGRGGIQTLSAGTFLRTATFYRVLCFESCQMELTRFFGSSARRRTVVVWTSIRGLVAKRILCSEVRAP